MRRAEVLVLDSGGFSRLSERSRKALAMTDFPKTGLTDDSVGVEVARRAAELRRLARRGSAVDALVYCASRTTGHRTHWRQSRYHRA
jgi:hypothetical protein